MDCVKLYFKDNLIGVLTYNRHSNNYAFIKNKCFDNKYIDEIMGINNKQEIYFSHSLFSFFFSFLKKYSNGSYENEYDELIKIATLKFDHNQFWIGA